MVSMRYRIRLTVVFAAALSWQAASLPAADLRADLSKLFELGAKNGAAEIASARTQYGLLKQSHPNDPRIDYAYALVLLNQGDYRHALPLVDAYLQKNGDDLAGARWKLWTLLQNRRDEDALSEAVAIGKRLPQDVAGRDGAKHAATARFLGNVLGYLERARVGAVDQKLKSRRTNELLVALGNRYLAAFDEGRGQVAARLAELKKKQQADLEARSQSTQKRQQEIQAAIEQGNDFLAAKNQSVDSSGERLQEARRRMNVVGSQLAALAEDRARLGVQIVAAQAELAQLHSPKEFTVIDPSVWDPKFKNQPVSVGNSRGVVLARNAQAQYLAAVIGALNKQAFNLDRRILALQGEAAMAMGNGRQETQNLVDSATVIGKTEKRTAELERKARRLEAKQPASAGRLTVEMTRLSTYLPLPYAEESKRVLGWFEK